MKTKWLATTKVHTGLQLHGLAGALTYSLTGLRLMDAFKSHPMALWL